MKKRSLRPLWSFGLAAFSLIGLIVAQTYMLFEASEKLGDNDEDNIQGEVGLRKYFDSGTGTLEDPFVITRPIHLYNLSRLQALGVFSSQKYFQLGSTSPIDGTDHFYYSDTASGTAEEKASGTYTRSYLYLPDDYTSLYSIGSTATPFYGIFNGQGYTIDNLRIDSDPEDIGVFGYIASGAQVTSTNFSNLKITDNGYGNFLSSFYTAGLEDASSSIHLLKYNGTEIVNTWPTADYTDLSKTFTLDTSGITSTLIPYSNVEYSLRSTNTDLFRVSQDGKSISINTLVLTGGTDTSVTPNVTYTANTDFLGSNSVTSQRIYVSGAIVRNNVRYSKILSSYSVQIKNDISSGSSFLTMTVARDPDEKTDGTSAFSYHHKTNIGFVAGHCDGKIESVYVYKGSFSLNNTKANYTSQAAETDIGLVGEVGINIDNKISPVDNLDNSGDTGIINFTNVYKNVRGTSITAEDTNGDSDTLNDGTQYYYFTPITGSLYSDYLRKRLFTPSADNYYYRYITDQPNSIDFLGQRIITEDDTKSRGIGIFKLNTANYSNVNLTTNYGDGLGKFNVTYDSTSSFTDVYYSTAELNATAENMAPTPDSFYAGSNDIYSWNQTSSSPRWRLNQGTNIPSVPFMRNFSNEAIADGDLTEQDLLNSQAFERNFNYLVNFQLSNSSALTTNYFSSTNSNFLADYFTYKLKDKEGKSLSRTSPDFGLMIKERSGTSYTNTDDFYSYLKITGNSAIDKMTISDSTVPAGTIQFSVANANGANITVIARSKSDASSYVGIYDLNYINQTDEGKYPSFAMYLPPSSVNDASQDGMPYSFSYNNTSRILSSSSSLPAHGASVDRLYAHTFFVPAGNYYLGSPNKTAYIYYIAAQGQEGAGDISNLSKVYLGSDTIKDMDFLLYDPKSNDPSTNRAYFSFMAKFTSSLGTLTIDVNEVSSTNHQLTFTYVTDSLQTALLQNAQDYTVQVGTEGNLTAYKNQFIPINYTIGG
ncbi:MAG: hypothetical protein LKJ88_06735 [Bacilli bacterium]|jgi:hypothetical protein|nr:hypothetical protein [Bacilli bacterium]